MAGLFSTVGLVVMLKALMRTHSQRAVLLGITVLVTVITADSPVADESLLDSTHQPVGFLGNIPSSTGSSLSALPNSRHTAFESPDSPGAWARTNTDHKSSILMPTPTRSQLQPQKNLSSTTLSNSTPQNLEQTTTFSKQQDGASEQTVSIMTLKPGQPLEATKLAFRDFMADESYGKMVNPNQLNPSSINTLPSTDKILFPGYNVPYIAPHLTSPLSEPTEVSPEDFYPTNTMDVDWGSGDYLETMSFYNSDKDYYDLVTKVPSDPYDLEEYTESYDTSFPSRVGISPSSLLPLYISPSPSLMTTYSTIAPLKSIYPSSSSSSVHFTMEPTSTADSDIPDIDWPDIFTIQPTDVLLPDMNSLEYYTTQLTKENNSSESGAEHRGNVTVVSISSTDVTPTSGLTNDTTLTEDESSTDMSGFEPHDEPTTVVPTEESPHVFNVSEPFLHPSIVPTHFLDHSSSTWGSQFSTIDWSTQLFTVGLDSTVLTETVQHTATPSLPNDLISSSSLTDVHWFVTESFSKSTMHTTAVLTATMAFSPVPTEPAGNTTADTTELTPQDSTFTTEQILNITSDSTESTSNNVTLTPPVVLGDQWVTEDGVDILATMTLIPASSEVNTASAAPTSTTATTTTHQATTKITETSTSVNIISTTGAKTTATA